MTAEPDPADLDLELTTLPDDPTAFRVALRFRLPESDVELDLLKGRAPSARFAVESLLERQANAANYGAALGEMLLADADLLAAWREARGIAHSRGQRLRLRLLLGSGAESLHTLRWETLRIPGENGFLAQSENLLFSRYLPSRDRRPVVAAPVSQAQALVVIANPTGLGAQLAPVDVEGELRRAGVALGDMPLLTLAGGERATLAAIEARLAAGVALLYLVCHGQMVRGAAYLALEDEQGAVAWTAGAQLAQRLEQMSERPKLVVLAACQGAGTGEVTGNPALAAVGPLLVDAGAPAVVAMQGNVLMRTVERMMPVFFSELRRHGVIDLALATARRRAQDQADWWAPALYMRLRSGRLFVGEETTRPQMRPAIPRQEWEPETVPIPAGEFRMGSDDPDAQPWERPSCTVVLPDYRMGKRLVTNKEFEQFVRKTQRLAAPEWGWDGQKPARGSEDQPVIGVTWFDALAYCQWLSAETGRRYILPSEAQWEKAARGDYGCQGMFDGPRQWTRSLWGEKRKAPDPAYVAPGDSAAANDLTAARVIRRILRGGAADVGDARIDLRCTARQNATPDSPGLPGKRFGLRVVMELDGE